MPEENESMGLGENNIENTSMGNDTNGYIADSHSINDEDQEILFNLETLLPNDLIPNDNIYMHTLDWALNNKSIKNLAITGTYGSGKSSVLKSFWNNFNEKNHVLEISAATFTDIEQLSVKEAEPNNQNKVVNMLEYNIMQQMFYKVDPQRIPDSRFNRIQSKNIFQRIIDFITVFIVLFAIYVSLRYELYIDLYKKTRDNTFTSIQIIFSVLFILFLILSIYRILKITKGLKIKSLGIGKSNIELNTEGTNTVFNKYLDEIIYFFKKNNYSIVVFEDLDRFNNLDIFERLRGLNQLLNQSEELNKKTIVFIYALKDDIFSSNDRVEEIQNRTKFFDFIIPLVKIMHSSNAESILLKKLENFIETEESESDGISKNIITDVSLFISDMRVLKNICNEYLIFKSALKNSSVVQNKLFAIIVYKNIYPKDYSELLYSQGKLANVFKFKNKVSKKIIESKKRQIQEKTELLYGIENEYLSELDELAVIYLRKSNLLNGSNIVYLNNKQFKIIDKNEMLNFIELVQSLGSDSRNDIRNPNNGFSVPLNKFLTADGKAVNMLKRIEFIKSKNDTTINKLNLAIEQLKQEVNEVNSYPFSELIKHTSIDAQKEIELMLEDMELLQVLLLQGWIDENYEEYVTYFYEGAMSFEDLKFLKQVRLNRNPDFNYVLKYVNEVQRKLEKEHFETEAVLNYSLFSYLLNNNNDDEKILTKKRFFLELLSNKMTTNKVIVEFILGFIDYCDNENLIDEERVFLNELSSRNPELWISVESELKSKAKIKQFFLKLFSTISVELFESLNYNDSIKKTIEEDPDFLHWWDDYESFNLSDQSKLSEVLKRLNVKVTNLNPNLNSVLLKQSLIDSDAYEITLSVIQALVRDNENENNVNYAEIINHPSTKIRCRVDEEINRFVEEILLCHETYFEDEEQIIELLNNKTVLDLLKIKIIEKWSGQITLLKSLDVNLDVYLKIVDSKKLETSWDNLFYFFVIVGDDAYHDHMIEFIDSIRSPNNLIDEFGMFIQEIELNKLKHSEESGLNILFNSIAQSTSFTNQQLLTLLNSLSNEHNKLFESTTRLLVERNLLPWEKDFYTLIKAFDSDLSYQYLVNFVDDDFIDKFMSLDDDLNMYNEVISSEDVDLMLKVELMIAFLRVRKTLDSAVVLWYINEFKNADFSFEKIIMEFEDVENLLTLDDLTQEDRSLVFIKILKTDVLEKKIILDVLRVMPKPFSELTVVRNRNIIFDNNETVFNLMNILLEKKLIASFKVIDSNIIVNSKNKFS